MFIRICLLLLFSVPLPGVADTVPPLQLATVYRGEINLQDYWVSEKLDGVRGYWDGQHLWSRQGHLIAAPKWFTAPLPPEPLDGELWIGRQQFEAVAAILRQHSPDEEAWKRVKYMLFDLPADRGPFSHRVERLRAIDLAVSVPWIQAVEQRPVADEAALMSRLDRVVAGGGEGLMLHHGDAMYRQGRSNDLLKLKPWQDAEAQVIAHLPGKGKYTGLLGALLVETPEGIRFRLGSGFSDAQRRAPPPVGSQVTYKFTGFTARGVPRFASFLRERAE